MAENEAPASRNRQPASRQEAVSKAISASWTPERRKAQAARIAALNRGRAAS